MRDLGTLGGGFSFATGINASGQVVGASLTTGGSAMHAFLYGNGSMHDLGSLGEGNSFATGINASGQVVGFVGEYGAGRGQAFLYSNGSMSDLGNLGQSGSSVARAINGSGQIVGSSAVTAESGGHAALWSGGAIHDLNSLAPTGWVYEEAEAINRHGQIVGTGSHNGTTESFLLTLHPDWQGGDGNWDDETNSHWNYAGLGVLAGLNPGAPHDVLIRPTGSATIDGSTSATVHSLVIAGRAGQVVTLNLNNGTTATTNGTFLVDNAVLTGSGRLAGDLTNQHGTIKVAGGQSMQITGGLLRNEAKISVIGTSANPANLEVSSTATNQATGQINLQNANVSFSGGLTNAGRINAAFGNSNIAGNVTVTSGGKIILSTNSTTTFYDTVDVRSGAELRVSSGASAVFFGMVRQHTGSVFGGAGSKAYEGGFSIGGSPGLGLDSGNVSLGGDNAYLEEIGGLTACTASCDTDVALMNHSYDKYIVNGKLSFGGTLQLTSWQGYVAKAGDRFDIFDWGSSEGQFAAIDASGLQLAAGTRLDASQLYTTGTLLVTTAPVPEPESYALLLAGLGVAGLLVGRRRQGGHRD